jgi:hypothetical protein
MTRRALREEIVRLR